jgi:hypothetical protein
LSSSSLVVRCDAAGYDRIRRNPDLVADEDRVGRAL